MAIPQQYPDLMQFIRQLSMNPNNVEVVEQPLYDYVVYPTAGVASQKFFQVAQGSGNSASPGNTGNPKTIADTNMIGTGGQLPAPMAFFITGIEIVVDPGSASAANNFSLQKPLYYTTNTAAVPATGDEDVNAILSTGQLTFNISQKPYYQDAPLYRFPPSSTLVLDAMGVMYTNAASLMIASKLRALGRLRTINPGIGIATGVNFDVTITWPAVVATPSGNNARLGCILNGFQFRAA